MDLNKSSILLDDPDTLGIESNNFHGTIPSELASIDDLRFVSLHNNAFSGQIPSEFGHLSRLAVLKVDFNDLSGTMPPEVCDLRGRTLWELVVDCGEISCESSCCTDC